MPLSHAEGYPRGYPGAPECVSITLAGTREPLGKPLANAK